MAWASYGEYDRRRLNEACQRHGVSFSLSNTHLNVKRLVALAAGSVREDGMGDAMRRLGVQTLPGSRHHRGCDDAANIATILGRVFRDLRA